MLKGQMAREAERLLGVRVSVNGIPANLHDLYQFVTVTIIRYGIEADFCGLTSVTQCAYRRTVLSLPEIDLQTYAQDMKTAKTEFIAYAQSDQGVGSFRGFKRRVSRRITYKWVISTLERFWGCFRSCLLWLSFDERLLLTTNEDAIGPEVLDYIEYEETLAHSLSDGNTLDQLSLIIRDWFQDFSLGEHEPDGKFGPGAVADAKGRISYFEKAQACAWDPEVVQIFAEMYDADVDEVIPGRPSDSETIWRNRIIFRPKNALKHRIISAEPTWLSWLQQDLKGHLFQYVEAHRGIMTWFSNQGESRKLALEGSESGEYATIDFSNASDSVKTRDVDRLFQYTYFHDALLAARSREAELPRWGARVLLDKFAPMGSATCFWTMDVILCACCELACREVLGRSAKRGDYVVYGDDVVIRRGLVSHFLRNVSALGMSVNADKSYWGTDSRYLYRESCGIEAYGGLDCTPLRYSRFQEPVYRSDCPSDGTWLPSVVDLMNRLLMKGLWNARSAVVSLLNATMDRACANTDSVIRDSARRMRHVWDTLLRVDASDYAQGQEGPTCVVVPDGTATNFRCKRRWNATLQRGEVLASVFSERAVSTYKQDGYWDNDQWRQLWYFRARSELRTAEPSFQRVMASAAGASSQQWRDVWIPE